MTSVKYRDRPWPSELARWWMREKWVHWTPWNMRHASLLFRFSFWFRALPKPMPFIWRLKKVSITCGLSRHFRIIRDFSAFATRTRRWNWKWKPCDTSKVWFMYIRNWSTTLVIHRCSTQRTDFQSRQSSCFCAFFSVYSLLCVVVAVGEGLFIEGQIELDQEEKEEKILIQWSSALDVGGRERKRMDKEKNLVSKRVHICWHPIYD